MAANVAIRVGVLKITTNLWQLSLIIAFTCNNYKFKLHVIGRISPKYQMMETDKREVNGIISGLCFTESSLWLLLKAEH